MLKTEDKKKIAEELSLRKVKMVCPMCRNQHFIMADGYFAHPEQDTLEGFTLGSRNIPTIPIICSNCGFVSQHALGVLGLLSKKEIKGDGESK